MGTPTLRRYLELSAKKLQQKNAPMVYGSHSVFEVVLFLFLSMVIKAENNTINPMPIADFIVNGAEKRKIDAIAVNTT